MAVVDLEPHTAAVAAALRAADLLTGIGRVPRGGGWEGAPGSSAFVPYVVVWPEQSMFDGSLANPEDVADVAYLINSWAATAPQAQRLGDQVRDAIMSVEVDSRRVMRVIADHSLGVTVDPDKQPDIWSSRDRYRLLTSPVPAS